MEINKIYNEDCLNFMKKLPDNFINTIVTSPPYNKKSANRSKSKNDIWSNGNAAIKYDSFNDNMNENEYQEWQIKIINECIRILKPDGSFFYNHKNRTINKEIISPYQWIIKSNAKIKQEIIWDRKMMVEMDKVRFYPKTEKIFWLVKDNIQPYFNAEFARMTDIWEILPTQNEHRNNHPAPFPIKLAERCICSTTKKNDLVYDPFMGSGTTAVAAIINDRNYIGSELSKNYCDIANKRLKNQIQIKLF